MRRAVDIAVSGRGLRGDGQVGAEQEEHPRRVLGRRVDKHDGDAAMVRLLQGLGVVNLEHDEVIRLQLEPDIRGQLGGLGVLGPSEHDLGAILAHGVVGAVPGGSVLGLHRDFAPADDHVMGAVALGHGLELGDPEGLAGGELGHADPGADVVIILARLHAWC